MNIIEALEANGIDYKKGSRNFEYKICCPFCPDNRGEMDTDFKFGFNIQTGQGHCFHAGCNQSFSQAALHAIIEKLELGEIQEIQKKVRAQRKTVVHEIALPEGYEKLQSPGWSVDGEDYYLHMAWRYALKRGLTPEQIREKKIGYAECGPFKYRIIFPVIYKRKLYGIVGRDFTERQKLKYKNSEGIKAIYNIPDERGENAVLTEGVLDALAIERVFAENYVLHGTDSLAVLGASLSEEQLKMLKGYKKFYLWPDPDRGGIKSFWNISSVLQELGEVHWIMPEDGQEGDPSDMDNRHIVAKLENSKLHNTSTEARLKAWLAFHEE